jgi:hypothetical protein
MLDTQISEVGMTPEAFAVMDINAALVCSCLMTSRDTIGTVHRNEQTKGLGLLGRSR